MMFPVLVARYARLAPPSVRMVAQYRPGGKTTGTPRVATRDEFAPLDVYVAVACSVSGYPSAFDAYTRRRTPTASPPPKWPSASMVISLCTKIGQAYTSPDANSPPVELLLKRFATAGPR